MVDKYVELTSKLWLYAVHSNNKSLFDFLHDYKIQPPKSSYKSCFYECLKCHNNDLATYIQNNYLQNAKLNNSIFLYSSSFNISLIAINC